MISSEEEVAIISPFGGSIASDARELEIDEDVSVCSLVPSCHFVPDSIVVIREGVECVRRVLEEVAASDGRAEEIGEGDSIVDIMGSLEKILEVNQKNSHLRTFCNVQIFCQ